MSCGIEYVVLYRWCTVLWTNLNTNLFCIFIYCI